jgi:trans-aconitate 2-methyltransferase
MTREWNAGEYERLADPMTRWGGQVLERLTLTGNETVLDAGCGTGRVTAQLLARLPHGHVIGVDASAAMIEQARERFATVDRVTLQAVDLLTLTLPARVDAILSTATFHWILDHAALFAQLATLLRPGGQLVAQCGGAGNIDGVRTAIAEVIQTAPFEAAFANWHDPWEIAGPDITAERLTRAGFEPLDTWLNPEPVTLESQQHLADYLETIVLGTHLLRLTQEQQRLFAEAVAATLIRQTGQALIDYVRLNIIARRVGGSRVR